MTKVFISYSRKDKAIAENINIALKEINLDSWIDWDDIPPTADWWDQIQKGIETADAFIFLLSPNSVTSKVCGQEIDHAVRNGKRLIPLVVHDVNADDVHVALSKLNWIYFREQDDFAASLKKLETGIKTDLAWVESHRRLQVRAIEWEKRKDRSLLLRGKDLRGAEERLATVGQKDPLPTDLQRQYVLESRRAESKTRNRIVSASGIAITLLAAFLMIALNQLDAARALVLASQAQVAYAEKNYNIAALYAYQANQIHENEPAKLLLSKLPYENFPLGKALLGHTGVVSAVAWSQENELASASWDNTIIIWDTETHQSLLVLKGHTSRVNSIAWSRDGKLASASDDNTIIIWDLKTGQPTQILTGHKAAVTSVAWSQDGRLASASEDHTIIIWDLKTNEPVQTLQGHTSFVESVAWSQDGRLASASWDTTVIIWNLDNGMPGKNP